MGGLRAAVLVMAHEQPDQLARLVESLRCEWIDIYLHIDAKAALAPFEDAAPPRPGVRYLRGGDRVRVRWGGLSVVEATVNLLRAARSRGRYDRYALLSGTDVLARPLSEVRGAWATDIEFLRVDRRLDAPDAPRREMVARRHFQDDRWPVRQRLLGRLPRRVDETVPLYHGSTWWALTSGAAEHALAFLDEHPRWLRFLRRCQCSDEIVFHSILMSSPYAARISQDLTQDELSPRGLAAIQPYGVHFIDWTDPEAYHPAPLTTAHLPAVRASGALFARKLGPDSAGLVAALAADAGMRAC